MVGHKMVNGVYVIKREEQNSFLLLKPRVFADSNEIAKSIAVCSGVKEVFLTSGEYGFVVVVNGKSNSVNRIKSRLNRFAKGAKISVATNHYGYRTRI
jgi:hypothetical protein